jgi:hypothetical protein
MLSACADDGTAVGESIDTKQKNTGALLDTSKQVGLEPNPEKTKYMLTLLLSEGRTKELHKDSEQVLCRRGKVKIVGFNTNRSKMTKEEVNIRINSGNACYHLVQSSVLSPAVWERKG